MVTMQSNECIWYQSLWRFSMSISKLYHHSIISCIGIFPHFMNISIRPSFGCANLCCFSLPPSLLQIKLAPITAISPKPCIPWIAAYFALFSRLLGSFWHFLGSVLCHFDFSLTQLLLWSTIGPTRFVRLPSVFPRHLLNCFRMPLLWWFCPRFSLYS